jgi:hypothetical protein
VVARGASLHHGSRHRASAHPIRPHFEKNRAFIVEHTIDPDLWRNAGFSPSRRGTSSTWTYYGKFPFAELPEEFDRAIEKFGPSSWRATENCLGGPLRCSAGCGAVLLHPARGYALSDVNSFGVGGALRRRRSRSVSRRPQLQRRRHRPRRHPLALRRRVVHQVPESADDPAGAGAVDPDMRAFMFQTLRDVQLAAPALKADRERRGSHRI